jgi:hypothetical protein
VNPLARLWGGPPATGQLTGEILRASSEAPSWPRIPATGTRRTPWVQSRERRSRPQTFVEPGLELLPGHLAASDGITSVGAGVQSEGPPLCGTPPQGHHLNLGPGRLRTDWCSVSTATAVPGSARAIRRARIRAGIHASPSGVNSTVCRSRGISTPAAAAPRREGEQVRPRGLNAVYRTDAWDVAVCGCVVVTAFAARVGGPMRPRRCTAGGCSRG